MHLRDRANRASQFHALRPLLQKGERAMVMLKRLLSIALLPVYAADQALGCPCALAVAERLAQRLAGFERGERVLEVARQPLALAQLAQQPGSPSPIERGPLFERRQVVADSRIQCRRTPGLVARLIVV